MFDPPTLLCLNAALVISAVSTLDSALSSAAKLAIRDMKLAPETQTNGRIAMAVFMAGGLALMLADVKDLYAAVAVSGTASLFLAPVVIFQILGGVRGIPVWAFTAAFVASVGGSALYFFVAAKTPWATELFNGAHKYTALLWICIAVLSVGIGAFALGAVMRKRLLEADA